MRNETLARRICQFFVALRISNTEVIQTAMISPQILIKTLFFAFLFSDSIVESIEQLDDGMDHVPRLKGLTRLEKYVIGCLHAMRWFNRVVQLSAVQGRIYIPPGLDHLPHLYKAQY